MAAPFADQSLHNRVWWREPVCWLLASAAFVGWLVWGPDQVMNGLDYTQMHHFYKVYLRDTLMAGELPLWNPYTLLGRPFLADPEVGAFYPPTWLFIVLPESVAYWLMVSGHFAIGGWGMSRLARAWGAPSMAAIFAGVAFLLSTHFLGRVQVGLVGFVCTIAWWPWAMRVMERLCRRFLMGDCLRLSSVLAVSFMAGHPHAFWLCGCSFGFYVLPRCFYGSLKSAFFRTVRSYGSLAGSAVVAFALCAVAFLPLLELSAESNRLPSKMLASFYSLPMEGLYALFWPVPAWVSGGWESNLYIGFPLVILGVLQLCCIRRLRSRALLFLALVCLIISLGQKTLFFDILYPLVPSMGQFRLNSRFTLFTVFALMIGAAIFWRRGRSSLRTARWLSAGVIALSVTLLLFRWHIFPFWLAALGGLAGGLIVWRWRLGVGRYAFAGWVVLWSIDYLPLIAKYRDEFRAAAPSSFTTANDFPADVQRQLAAITGVAPLRIFAPYEVLKANSGMENGYSLVIGYVALTSSRVWNYLHLMAGRRPGELQLTGVDPEVFQGGPCPYPDIDVAVGWNSREKCLVPIGAALRGRRAWLSSQVLVVPDWHKSIEVMVSKNPGMAVAIMEESPRLNPNSDHPGGNAEIIRFRRNSVVVSTDCANSAILVLAEAWYPGWFARIDGAEAPVFPVNAWMRGVEVPAGRHEVVFYYRSRYLTVGFGISLVALGVWLYLWRREVQAHGPGGFGWQKRGY